MFVIAQDLCHYGFLCTTAYNILFCLFTNNLVGVQVLTMYFEVYVKHYLRFLLARCSPAVEGFFSRLPPRGKLACHGYIIWISAELRSGARGIKRR